MYDSQREEALSSLGHLNPEAYSFEIDPDDEAMVALNSKRVGHMSRISVLRAAIHGSEPELVQNFHQRGLLFEAELQSLNSDPAPIVLSGCRELDASLQSIQTLFVRESEVISKFQNERYGKPIEELFKSMGSIMNGISTCAQDHHQRIQVLQQLRSEYNEITCDSDMIFHKFQARIKSVNAEIEDLQAKIQRCYDDPQSISIVQRIPFGIDCVLSEAQFKKFRASIEQHQQKLQAKIDQKLKRPQGFYSNSSLDRKAALDSLKSDADGVVSEAQRVLEIYLNELNQPLDAPLKASREFCEWLKSRLAAIA